MPALPRLRGVVLPARNVERGAREDAIAESWYDWQEGERETCPDCAGARLNPLARAVRLEISNVKSQISNSAERSLDLDRLAQ